MPLVSSDPPLLTLCCGLNADTQIPASLPHNNNNNHRKGPSPPSLPPPPSGAGPSSSSPTATAYHTLLSFNTSTTLTSTIKLGSSVTAPPALPLPTPPCLHSQHQSPTMFHNIDTTAWLSNISRRKLHTATSPSDRPREGDTLLRRVLLRNSITRVDLALAEAQDAQLQPPPQPSSVFSTPSPATTSLTAPTLPLAPPSSSALSPAPTPSPDTVDNEFVFPSLPNGRVYSPEETAAEERWLDSLLDTLSDGDDDGDDDDDYAHALVVPVESSPEPEEEEDYLDLEGLAWLMSAAVDEQPVISVPSPTSVPVRPLSPPRLPPAPVGPLELPFYYPLPDDSDDDLSTPGMEEDVEGESDADSLEWPCTPGSQFRSTASLGRSSSTSSLNNLVASASEHTQAPSSLSSPRERAVLKPARPPTTDKLKIHSIHGPDKQLYMSPAEQPQKQQQRHLLSLPSSASSPAGHC